MQSKENIINKILIENKSGISYLMFEQHKINESRVKFVSVRRFDIICQTELKYEIFDPKPVRLDFLSINI